MDNHAITTDAPMRLSAVRLALSAGLGSGFSLLVLLAVKNFLVELSHGQVSELFSILVVSVGVVAFIEPVLERFAVAAGVSHHHAAPLPAGRIARLVGFALIAGASVSHGALHDMVSKNLIGAIAFLTPAVITPAATTYAWARQSARGRAAAWQGGAIGAIFGGGFMLASLTILLAVKAVSLSTSELELLTLANAVQWGAAGLAGGLVLDRKWGATPVRGIAIALLVSVAIGWVIVIVLAGFSGVSDLDLIVQDVARVLGWVAGIMVFGPTVDAMLRPPVHPSAPPPMPPTAPPPLPPSGPPPLPRQGPPPLP